MIFYLFVAVLIACWLLTKISPTDGAGELEQPDGCMAFIFLVVVALLIFGTLTGAPLATIGGKPVKLGPGIVPTLGQEYQRLANCPPGCVPLDANRCWPLVAGGRC